MAPTVVLDAARRRSPCDPARPSPRSPAAHQGSARYPPDPPTVEEIIAVMRRAGGSPYGLRTRALIVLCWRAGSCISEALAVREGDLDGARDGP